MADLSFSRNRVLKQRSSELYPKIKELIFSFAVIGHTDVASRILSKLNKHDRLHQEQEWFRPLWFLWDFVNAWPEGEKEQVYDLIREERERDGQPKAKAARIDKTNDEDITEEDVNNKLNALSREYTLQWWYPSGGKDGSNPHTSFVATDAKRNIAREIIDAVNASEPDPTVDVSSALVSALDAVLSIERNNESADPAPSSMEILKMIAKRMSVRNQMETLAQSRIAWRNLVDGDLAKALDLDEEKIKKFAQELEDVLDERFRSGRLMLPDKPMRELLSQIEHNGLHIPNPEDFPPLPEEFSKTFFRKPASAEQIAEAERSLGIELPEDYKQFLRESNGFGPVYSGIIYDPPLYSLDKVRWLRDDEWYFVDLPFDPIDDTGVSPSPVKVGKALEIGTEDVFSTWLVPPSKTTEFKDWVRGVLNGDAAAERKEKLRRQMQDFAGSEQAFWDMEWACVQWESGGAAEMTCWSSFGAYLAEAAEEGSSAGEEEEDLLRREEWWGYAFVKGDGHE